MRWFLVALAVLFLLDHGVTIGNFHAHADLKSLGLFIPGLFLLLFCFYFFFIRDRIFSHRVFNLFYDISIAAISIRLIFLGVSTLIAGGCEDLITSQPDSILISLVTYVQSENYCGEFGLCLILLGVLGICSSLAVYRRRATV